MLRTQSTSNRIDHRNSILENKDKFLNNFQWICLYTSIENIPKEKMRMGETSVLIWNDDIWISNYWSLRCFDFRNWFIWTNVICKHGKIVPWTHSAYRIRTRIKQNSPRHIENRIEDIFQETLKQTKFLEFILFVYFIFKLIILWQLYSY